MNRTLAIVLGLIALGAAGFGVVQYLDAQKLRGDLAALDKERADLRKRLWEAEQRSRQPIVAAAPAAATTEAPATESAATEPAGDGRRNSQRRNFGEMAGRITAALDSPEVQRLMSIQQKGALDARYAGLFRELNLSPDQLEKFKSLLVERQTAAIDVMAAAREQGLNPFESRDEMRALVKNAQDDVDASIRAMLGDTAYSQYKNYDNTMPQRAVVSQLEQRLSYSATPLTPAQSSQLVRILAQSSPAATGGGGPGGGMSTAVFVGDGPGGGGGARMQFAAGMGGGGSVPISSESLTQAATVLSPQQLSALQQLQTEQQAQSQLGEQMRATIGGGGRGRGGQPPGG